MTPNAIALAIAVPLVGWRMYARIRRSIGRQESKLWRHWTAAIFFPLMIAMLMLLMHAAPLTQVGLLAGAAVGGTLGVWGLKLTAFEKTPSGAFFTPNPYLGSALIALFAMRVAFRLFQMYEGQMPPPGDPTGGLGQSPLTLVVFGLLAGYYSCYAIGLLRWRHAPDGAATGDTV